MSRIVKIERLDGAGEGVAADGALRIPFALPGETVRIEGDGGTARLREVLEASPHRVAPACTHFGQCGGCALQHLEPGAYRDWKAGRVAGALSRLGVEVGPMVAGSPGTRRRATFTARRAGGRLLFGFAEAASHRIVPLAECPVLVPAIVRKLPQLRELAAAAVAGERPLRMTVTATDSGLDIRLSGAVPASRRQALIRLALAHGFARLTLEGELLVETARPMIRAGKAMLSPPSGGFLQAAAPAEAVMASLAATHLSSCRRIVDLFAGSGAFALRLAEFATVHAVDSEAAALQSLDRTFRETGGLKPVTVAVRDLFRRPLSAQELGRFDGAVIDPPRAGALAQCRELAQSGIARIAAISCNPATLARDLAVLAEGGYRVVSVTPVDQFLWTAHVEVVALLEKS